MRERRVERLNRGNQLSRVRMARRDEYLARYAERWRTLNPTEFPFVYRIVDEFAGHDDTDQFRAGLDLLLAGLRLQAENLGATH